MKYHIFIIILSFCFVSCSKHSKHWEILTKVEAFIEERPDSALNILQGIDKVDLSSKEENAKYALLLSTALDKNNVVSRDFEILQPAIEYYKKHGSLTNQMRTLYYQGQIHYINGQYAQALTCLNEAIEKSKNSNDYLTKAQLYTTQGDINALLTKWDDAIKSKLSAAEYYSKLDSTDRYVSCLLDIFNNYTLKGDYNNAEKYFKECCKSLENASEHTHSKYYSYYINYLIATNEFDKIAATIQEYQSNVSKENLDYLSIAYAYGALGDINNVAESLSKNNLSDDTETILRQYAIVTALDKHITEGRNLLEVYKENFAERNTIIYTIYEKDTQYIQQKRNKEILQEKEKVSKRAKTIITISCIFALIVTLYILKIFKKRLQDSQAENIILEGEKLKFEQLYSDTITERDALTKTIEDTSIKDEAKAIIRDRLEILNKVIISQITGTSSANKKAYQELEALVANKDAFIKSNRLYIEGNNADFINTLKKSGLTNEEIDICCLYAIGLKGKDIKAYTSKPRHYNQSADIRHKLGLTENDTNLSIFLREMLEK